MKKVLFIIVSLPVVLISFLGCKDMDSIHRDFIVPGGLVYVGPVKDAVIYSGRYRVEVSWEKSPDPAVKSARVFWNNYTDSVEVVISSEAEKSSVIIDNLEERFYTFFIKTYDNKGNASMPVELVGVVYGDRYQEGLLTRPVVFSQATETGVLSIRWGAADISNGAVATEISYESIDGTVKSILIDVGEENSEISDINARSFRHRTVFSPSENNLDKFYTEWATERILAELNRSSWIVTTDSYAVSSQLPAGGPPEMAIDGNINTYWHTDHTANPRHEYPHWLMVDLGDMYNIEKVRLTSRPNVVNSFREFIIQGSTDSEVWNNYGTFPFQQLNTHEDFPVSGRPELRYIRIWMLHGASFHASLAELSVFAY